MAAHLHVPAKDVRIGDVLEHPESLELGQVGKLEVFPSVVRVTTPAGLVWQFHPQLPVRVVYTTW